VTLPQFALPATSDRRVPRRRRLLVGNAALLLLLGSLLIVEHVRVPCWPFGTNGPQDPRSYAGAACDVPIGWESDTTARFATFDGMLGQYGIRLPAQAGNVRFLFEPNVAFNGDDYQLYLRFTASEAVVHGYLASLGAAPTQDRFEQYALQQDAPTLGADWSALYASEYSSAPVPAGTAYYSWSHGPEADGLVIVVGGGPERVVYSVGVNRE
jgi:hypothetical protein